MLLLCLSRHNHDFDASSSNPLLFHCCLTSYSILGRQPTEANNDFNMSHYFGFHSGFGCWWNDWLLVPIFNTSFPIVCKTEATVESKLLRLQISLLLRWFGEAVAVYNNDCTMYIHTALSALHESASKS